MKTTSKVTVLEGERHQMDLRKEVFGDLRGIQNEVKIKSIVITKILLAEELYIYELLKTKQAHSKFLKFVTCQLLVFCLPNRKVENSMEHENGGCVIREPDKEWLVVLSSGPLQYLSVNEAHFYNELCTVGGYT